MEVLMFKAFFRRKTHNISVKMVILWVKPKEVSDKWKAKTLT